MNENLCNLQELRFTLNEGCVNLAKARSVLSTIPVANVIDPLCDVDRQKLTKAMDAIASAISLLNNLHYSCSDAIRKELQNNDEGIKREPVTTTEAWAVCQKCGKIFRAANIKQEINGLIMFTCDKCGGNGVLEELLIDNTND